MKGTKMEQMRTELKNSMERLCKAAEQDQECLSVIRERSFWERLMANNTRDLAKASIAEVELIRAAQSGLQNFIEIEKDADERERILIGVIDDLNNSTQKNVRKVCAEVGKVVLAVAKENKKVKKLGSEVSAAKSRVASSEASKKCVHEIVSALDSANLDGNEVVDVVKKAIETYFTKKKIVLRDEDKRTIIDGLKEQGAKKLEIDFGRGIEKKRVDDICEHVLDGVVSEGDRYSEFRDELIGFIDDFNQHREAVDPSGVKIEQLLEVKRRLRESQFEIALIGQFQGGKSTTFNALCGGREISPRGVDGGGVKTSAAVVMAQNIANGETKQGLHEWAEISWMGTDELRRRIRDAVFEAPERDYSLKELRAAINRSWKELEAEADEDEGRKDRKDMLQVATLQLRVLESGDYEKFSRKQIVPIDEFQEYVKFPIDWDDRWGRCNQAEKEFSIRDCLFSCVSSVLVRLHSPYLERLGCRITDCPGLFVNHWDTARAMSVMQRSNAIWFLCNGERAFTEGEVAILKHIRKHGSDWVKKCFFTLNAKHPASATRNIVQSNLAKVKDVGFCSKNIFCYNALVALRLQQIRSVGRAVLSVHDRNCLALESRLRRETEKMAIERINRATKEELVATIREMLSDTLHNTKDHDLYDPDMTDEEVLRAIEPVGGMSDVVTKLEKYLVANKASSILVDNGSESCRSALVCLQTTLKEIEGDADKKLSEAQREWEDAKLRLEAFQKDAIARFGFLLTNTAVDAALINDFYDKEETKIILEVKSHVLKETMKEWDDCCLSSSVERLVAASMKKYFMTTYNTHLQSYLNSVNGTHPTNQIYKDEILANVHRIWEALSDEWNEVEKEVPKLQGLKPDDSVRELSCNAWDIEFQSTFDLPVMWWETFRNAGDWLLNKVFGTSRVTTEQKIKEAIDDQLVVEKAIKSVKDSPQTTEVLKSMFGKVRTNTFANIKGSLDASTQNLEDKEKDAMARLDERNKDREQIAKDAKLTRETIIDPRIDSLVDFKNRVHQVYGE